jgi:hypothetical protein
MMFCSNDCIAESSAREAKRESVKRNVERGRRAFVVAKDRGKRRLRNGRLDVREWQRTFV